MSTIQHHLSDETLQDYVSGGLNVAMETLIACHLTICPSCRRRAEIAEALCGAALGLESTIPVSASALDVIAMDETSASLSPKPLQPAPKGTGLPAPLARLLPGPIDSLPWRSFGPGMKQYNLSSQPRKEGAFKLMSLDPGSRMSSHTHGHRELTFILSGSYSDEIGQYKYGDIADLTADHNHTPHVDSDVPCISLVATDAPVKFDGLIGKIVQPFVGI